MSGQNMHAEDAMKSELAKTAVRIFIWLAPFVIAGFGWFITSQLGDIKSIQKTQSESQYAQALLQEKQAGEMKALNAKLDTGVIWRITEIERRLNTVEQAQKTP